MWFTQFMQEYDAYDAELHDPWLDPRVGSDQKI